MKRSERTSAHEGPFRTWFLRGWFVAAALFFAIDAVVWSRSGTTIQLADTFYPLHPVDLMRRSMWSWNHLYTPFGQFDNDMGLVPWLLVNAVLARVFDATLAQVALLGAIAFLGWVGMLRLTLALGARALVAVCVAWLYAVNPLTQLEFGTAILINIVFYAALPWLYYALLLATHEDAERRARLRFAIVLTSLVVAPTLGLNPPILLLFAAAIVIWLVALRLRGTISRTFVLWCASVALLVLGAALWWLVPEAIGFLSNPPAASLAAGQFEYQRASVANVFRLNSWWIWNLPAFVNGAAGYDAAPVVVASGYALFALALVSFAINGAARKPFLGFLGAIAVLSLLVTTRYNPPFAPLIEALYHLPLMFLYRESTTKFPVVAVALLAIVAGSIDQSRRFSIGAAGAIVVSATVATIAMLSSELLVRGAIFPVASIYSPSAHVGAVSDWEEVHRFFARRHDASSVLVLPGHPQYQVLASNGFRGIDILPASEIPRPLALVGARPGYVAEPHARRFGELVQRLAIAGDQRMATLLAQNDVGWVVFRHDIDRAGDADADASAIDSLLGPPVERFGSLDIYRVSDSRAANVRESLAPSEVDRWIGDVRESEAPKTIDLARDSRVFAPDGSPTIGSMWFSSDPDVNAEKLVAINPTRRGLISDVEYPVFIDKPTAFALRVESSGGVRSYQSAPIDGRGVYDATFAGVVFPPGGAYVRVGPTAFSPQTVVRAPARARDFSENEPRFLRIRYESRAFQAPSHSATVRYDVRDLTSLTIGRTASSPENVDWSLVSVRTREGRIVCTIPLSATREEFDLLPALERCFRSNGLSSQALLTGTVERIAVVDEPRATPVSIDTGIRLGVRADEPLPSLAAATDPSDRTVSDSLRTPFFSRYEGVSRGRYLVTDELYDRFQLGLIGLHAEPHLRVAGWRSAWAADRAGDVWTVDVPNVVELLAIAAAIVIVSFSGSALRRNRDDPSYVERAI